MADNIQKMIADTFLQMAEGLETGSFGKRPKIALTGMGSEHGEANAMEAAIAAAKDGIDVYYIGTLESEENGNSSGNVITVKVEDEEAAHKKMEELLKEKKVDGAVTMHYPFPIGVSTVGRAVTPGRGREMYVATTTGTSSADRIEGMIKNAIYGIIAAKACGNAEPTVGILNVDGARQTEIALKQLKDNGYHINFAESARADGGCVMRGNDVLQGTPDIMVCDSLSGNILIKMLSSFTTGGSYEASGYGYGPGIGEGYDQLVMIISRASGAPLIAGAIRYAAQLVKGRIFEVAAAEFAAANKAGLADILAARKASDKSAVAQEVVTAPAKEVVTAQIAGIEIMDLEDGVQALWKIGVYAESGMGCTGPIILVADANLAKAKEELKKGGYIAD
ncbi:glycine reductase [Clostridium sp. AF19-22AC]|jgi:fatty acid/phospholipid biosynthesis enzyme|uniref:glycine/sarcosine/betaine reductase complex component C subunit alpha n=1 Tax=Clostridia TaxID=186801 RepID=UPI000E505DFA|nr:MULTISPECIES: glycine/sarcosine/betaine reductase complex component C subunit alpha [Clostridia]RHR21484.1 glycine reductase [Clostridium sp. AF19-22AC]